MGRGGAFIHNCLDFGPILCEEAQCVIFKTDIVVNVKALTLKVMEKYPRGNPGKSGQFHARLSESYC